MEMTAVRPDSLVHVRAVNVVAAQTIKGREGKRVHWEEEKREALRLGTSRRKMTRARANLRRAHFQDPG